MRMDIDNYTKRAGRVDLDGIDFDDFRSQPLDDDTRRCLRYMHDVEHHTVCYLRDLLVTSAHRDPEVTSFLTMWTFDIAQPGRTAFADNPSFMALKAVHDAL